MTAEQPSTESEPAVADIEQIVVFCLADQRYGIPIDAVQEIQQIVAFSEVPDGDACVIGMLNLRGVVIPALDMRVLLGLTPQDFHVDTPMIVCRTDGQLVSLVVDEVEDVVFVPEGGMAPPPKMHTLSSRMIGVCTMETGLVYLLDIDKLLAPVPLSEEGA